VGGKPVIINSTNLKEASVRCRVHTKSAKSPQAKEYLGDHWGGGGKDGRSARILAFGHRGWETLNTKEKGDRTSKDNSWWGLYLRR